MTSSSRTFHICTISNRLDEYAQMRASFKHAGFGEDNCSYTLFDNSTSNLFDPYRVIQEALDKAEHEFILFCHQDIRLDQGDGYQQLLQKLRELNARDPAWAVCGNAGVVETGERIMRITDPSGTSNSQGLPRKVYSLDENFIIIRHGVGVRTSSALSGFHLYATDLCFNAMVYGRTCYVIDFHLTHLSTGNPHSEAFKQSLEQLIEIWNPQLLCGIVETVTGCALRLSRYSIIRYALRRPRIERRLRAYDLAFVPCNFRGYVELAIDFVRNISGRDRRFRRKT